jgi:transcriptional regulator with XRE-family HTH domain
MISKIERGDVQPTAALLARLSGALEITLSELIAHAEGDDRLSRAADQEVWSDPDSGYSRRAVSPGTASPLELVEVELPAGAHVSMPADTFAFIHQQIWVLSGRLRFIEGDTTHELSRGDCLQLGEPAHCSFVNHTTQPCRYLVALAKRLR